MQRLQVVDVVMFVEPIQFCHYVWKAVAKAVDDSGSLILNVYAVDRLPDDGIDTRIVLIPWRWNRFGPLPLPLENLPELPGAIERHVERVVIIIRVHKDDCAAVWVPRVFRYPLQNQHLTQLPVFVRHNAVGSVKVNGLLSRIANPENILPTENLPLHIRNAPVVPVEIVQGDVGPQQGIIFHFRGNSADAPKGRKISP